MLAKVFSDANRAVIQEWRRKMLGGVNTAADINSGLCEVWADYVLARLPGASKAIGFDGSHVAVLYRGKLYDAECHGGADTWDALPFGAREKR